MTHKTNARIAGFAFLFYIAAGITGMVLFSQATRGDGITAKFVSIAQHVLQLRLTIILGLLEAVCALVLAVTLYAITRDQDSDLAMLALIFRVGEGLLGAISTRATLEMLWLGTSAGRTAPDLVTLQVLGTYLLAGPNWIMPAVLFAMGSTLFSYLFLRGRTIPVSLAWLGVVASVLRFRGTARLLVAHQGCQDAKSALKLASQIGTAQPSRHSAPSGRPLFVNSGKFKPDLR